jgi:group I intron endonuclease
MKISGIGFIYMITNPKRKIYIGSTIDFDYRFSQYKRLHCKGQTKLYRSLSKYGYENHAFDVIWAGPIEEMYKYETMIGWGFNALEKEEGLNCKLPKFGDTYSVFSDEIRLKISTSNKGFKHSKETRENMSRAGKGRIFTEEHRKNISNAFKGRKLPQKHIDILIACHKGKKQTLQHKNNATKARMKPVLQYDLNMNFIKEWESIKTAALELNINSQSIGCCCRNKSKKAGNFKWEFKLFQGVKVL